MDSCPLEISEVAEVVHLRFVVFGGFLRELIDLDGDLGILVRFRGAKEFGVHPRKIPGRYYRARMGPTRTVRPHQPELGDQVGIYFKIIKINFSAGAIFLGKSRKTFDRYFRGGETHTRRFT